MAVAFSPRRWLLPALAGALVAIAPAQAVGQVPTTCPALYYFGATYTFGTNSSPPKFYNFVYGYGTAQSTAFTGYARYYFSNILSNDGGAWLISPWIDVLCQIAYFPMPPYLYPQRVLLMTSVDHGGQLSVIFTPPRDDDECEEGGGDDDGGDDDIPPDDEGGWDVFRVGAGDSIRSPQRRAMEQRLNRSLRLGGSTIGKKSSTGAQTPGVALSCNDSGGGGGDSVWYCLIIDWYDLFGNYLYSEVITCWQEAAE